MIRIVEGVDDVMRRARMLRMTLEHALGDRRGLRRRSGRSSARAAGAEQAPSAYKVSDLIIARDISRACCFSIASAAGDVLRAPVPANRTSAASTIALFPGGRLSGALGRRGRRRETFRAPDAPPRDSARPTVDG